MSRIVRRLLFALGMLGLIAPGLAAQPLITQWGGKVVPEPTERTEIGTHFVLLTEFGKDTTASGGFNFQRYTDEYGTVGYNILSYQTVRAWRARYGLDRNREPVGEPQSVLITEHLMFGVLGDQVTAFLQNEVIHAASWRGGHKLLPVPRTTSDTPDDITPPSGLRLGPTAIAQYGTSVAFRHSILRREGLRDLRQVTPAFIGAGYSFGSMFQEAFLQAGLMDFDFMLDWETSRVRFVSFGGFAVARGGLLMPGPLFNDLTTDYQLLQAGARAKVSFFGFPVQYEFVGSSLRGFFVAPRTAEQWAIVAARGQPARKVYESKSPRFERFEAHRLRIGHFSFQVTNDSPGGKDSGPSFSAQMSVDVHAWLGAPMTPTQVLQRLVGR